MLGREAGAVDAVVDAVVDLVVERVDLAAVRFGVEVEIVVARERVELGFEHAHDVVVVVADDAFRFFVPQRRHRHAAADSPDRSPRMLRRGIEAVDRIGPHTGAVVEGPAALVANRIDDRHADRVFEPFELAHDDRAVRPRTRERHVEVIASGGRGKPELPSAVTQLVNASS